MNKNPTGFLSLISRSDIPVELHIGQELWHGVLVDCFEKHIKLELFEKFEDRSPSCFREGSSFSIQFVFKNARYRFNSKSIVFFETDNTLKIESPESIEKINTRNNSRFDVGFPLKIFSSFQNIFLSLVKNISESGLLIATKESLRIQNFYPFAVTIPIRGELKHLCFTARVIHLTKTAHSNIYMAGLEFIQLQQDTEQDIKSFVGALSLRKKGENGEENISELNLMKKQLNNDALLKIFSVYLLQWKNISRTKQKIFCTETSPAKRGKLEKILSPYYEAIFLENPNTIFSEIKDFSPDIILSEIKIGDFDIFKLIEIFEKKGNSKSNNFVIYTTNNHKDTIARALRYSTVSNYIVEPILPQKLIVRLNAAMSTQN